MSAVYLQLYDDAIDPYRVLGIPETCTQEQIKRAYRRLALKCHPDKNNGTEKAKKAFQALVKAYDYIKSEQKRCEYDTWRKSVREFEAYKRQFAEDLRRRKREHKERQLQIDKCCLQMPAEVWDSIPQDIRQGVLRRQKERKMAAAAAEAASVAMVATAAAVAAAVAATLQAQRAQAAQAEAAAAQAAQAAAAAAPAAAQAASTGEAGAQKRAIADTFVDERIADIRRRVRRERQRKRKRTVGRRSDGAVLPKVPAKKKGKRYSTAQDIVDKLNSKSNTCNAKMLWYFMQEDKRTMTKAQIRNLRKAAGGTGGFPLTNFTASANKNSRVMPYFSSGLLVRQGDLFVVHNFFDGVEAEKGRIGHFNVKTECK